MYYTLSVRSNSKGFAQVVIIIILIAVAVTGYLSYKNFFVPKSPLSGITTWKTYTNETYKFSVKYPPSVTLTENKKDTVGSYESAYLIYAPDQEQKGYVDKNGYSLNIAVYESPNKQGILKTLKSYSKNKCYPTFVCTDLSNNTFLNLPAKSYSMTDGKLYITYHYVERGDLLYVFETKYAGADSNKSNLNQIISTLKLTD